MWTTVILLAAVQVGAVHCYYWPVSSLVSDSESGRSGGAEGSWRGGMTKKTQKRSRDEMLHEVLRDQHPVTKEKDINLEDFLWSGSGDGDSMDYIFFPDLSSNENPATPEPSRVTQARSPPETGGVTAQPPRFDSRPLWSAEGKKLPKEDFLVRTVLLSNMTVIHNSIEAFKRDMEEKLTRAYRHAYAIKRYKREDEENSAAMMPTVTIHNIRSSLPEPEIEMIYTVSRDNQLIPAETAASALGQINDSEVSDMLGFPLVTKAEPYKARAQALVQQAGAGSPQMTSWLIAAVVVSTALAIVVLAALLLLLHRYRQEENRHRRLLASPGPGSSSNESNDSGGGGRRTRRRTGGSDGELDDASAFGLAKPKLEKLDSSPRPGGVISSFGSSGGNGFGVAPMEGSRLHKAKSELISSGEELFRPKDAHSRNSSLLGEESPSMADLSSNNTPETQRRRPKKASTKRQHKEKQQKAKVDQSAFPVKTPDRDGFLGPLSDLLEEEIHLPGESRETSAESEVKLPGTKSWTNLPKQRKSASTSTSSSCTSSLSSLCHPEEVFSGLTSPSGSAEQQQQDKAAPHSGDPSPPEAKPRAISAKSHIFRKGKVEAARLPTLVKGSSSQPRPWSAHESRLHADPVFAMRQRHWEGLAAGKKTLHRGQLLPGSTSEEELKEQLKQQQGKIPQTCWSECSSPRKQVRIQEPLPVFDREEEDPAEPIIQAIRVELKKFQRPKSPSLAGISVVSDPELLKRESEA